MNRPPPHAPTPPPEARAEYRYHLLRAASERFQTAFGALDPRQRGEVERQADQTLALETLVLASSEARDILIPERRVDEAVAEIRQRYPDDGDFRADLQANGLDEMLLRQALLRELTFDAVMSLIGSAAEPVTETDEQLFLELHRERFMTPERRVARHILVTINDDYAENRRATARQRIEQVAADLNGRAEDFGEFAQRHSECPSAMQQGSLGTLPPGQLYPELDAALFALAEGEISGVIESEIGFHLLLCERIELARAVTFEQARPRIQAILAARRQRDRQKTWIAELRQEAASRLEKTPA